MSATSDKRLDPLAITAGFVPWILFTLFAQRLAADGVAWSALLAVAVSLILVLRARTTGGPTEMSALSSILFTVIAVVGFVGGGQVDRWLFEWGRPLVGLVLGLTLLASAWSHPFTAEYARRSTPREYWDSSLFRRINVVLSAAWGVALSLIGVAALLVTALDAHAVGTGSPHLADFALNWVVPAGVIWWMVHFTNTYPDRAGRRETKVDAVHRP